MIFWWFIHWDNDSIEFDIIWTVVYLRIEKSPSILLKNNSITEKIATYHVQEFEQNKKEQSMVPDWLFHQNEMEQVFRSHLEIHMTRILVNINNFKDSQDMILPLDGSIVPLKIGYIGVSGDVTSDFKIFFSPFRFWPRPWKHKLSQQLQQYLEQRETTIIITIMTPHITATTIPIALKIVLLPCFHEKSWTYDESRLRFISESKLISADSISSNPASVAALETAFSIALPILIFYYALIYKNDRPLTVFIIFRKKLTHVCLWNT